MIFNNVIEMIGNTPMIKLNSIVEDDMADIYVKLEKNNPGASIKDRAALGMIEEAERVGALKKGDVIVEPTSGNTGIALAMIGRMKNYKVIITMPETMSKERVSILRAYGADVILTEGTQGMKGAIAKAEEIAKGKDGYFIPQQFANKANPAKHYATTAEEIIEDMKQVDAFVAGVGTGGTIIGIGQKLKEKVKDVMIVAMEPEASPVLSGGAPGPHKIQGIGAGFVTDIYTSDYVDEIILIKDEEALETTKALVEKEGIFVGISSGANIAAAMKIAKKLGKGKKVVTVAPDGGEKYISTGLFD